MTDLTSSQVGPTKIIIIRHAEKPATYGDGVPKSKQQPYNGVGLLGDRDSESLVTLGWERAGGIANLFCPTNGEFQSPELATPDVIYASNPNPSKKDSKKGEEKSQRPYQTVLPLSLKTTPINFNYEKKDYASMITEVLTLKKSTVLISWHHDDILPSVPPDDSSDSIVYELIKQTHSDMTKLNLPAGLWPEDRYDMIFVFDRPAGTGPFTRFTQVPQMLLAGDSKTPIG